MEEQLINIASDMAKRYWEIGNIITAFGVIQMYAFLYAIGEKPILLNYIRKGWGIIFMSLIFGSVTYWLLIYGCYYSEMLAIDGLEKLEQIEKTSFIAFIGRAIIIFMMLLMSIVAMVSDRIMNKEKYSTKR